MADIPQQPKLLTNFSDLLNLLTKDKIPHQVDRQQQRVSIPTKSGVLEGELLIEWDVSNPIVQVIQPLPFLVPENRIAACESAIARINHALMLPGFGLNHASCLLYYRLSIPRRSDGSFPVDELQLLFRTAISAARDFYLPLAGVVLQEQNPENVIAVATAFQQNDPIYNPTGEKLH